MEWFATALADSRSFASRFWVQWHVCYSSFKHLRTFCQRGDRQLNMVQFATALSDSRSSASCFFGQWHFAIHFARACNKDNLISATQRRLRSKGSHMVSSRARDDFASFREASELVLLLQGRHSPRTHPRTHESNPRYANSYSYSPLPRSLAYRPKSSCACAADAEGARGEASSGAGARGEACPSGARPQRRASGAPEAKPSVAAHSSPKNRGT